MIGLKQLVPAGLAVLLASCSDSAPELLPVSTPGTGSPSSRAVATTGEGPAGKGLVDGSLPSSGNSKAKVNEIFDEARRSADSGNYPGAALLLEEVVKIDPRHREALLLLAMVNLDRGSELEGSKRSAAYLRSAWALRQIRENYKDLNQIEKQLLPIALYNVASMLATEGKTEPALKSLGEAVDAGFANPEKISTDPDLESIRKQPKFHDLVDRAEGVLKRQATERAHSILAESGSFPFGFELPGLDGKAVSSADYRGKVMIVDIWGTWCPPCRREIPHFVALSKKYKDKGLEIVGINYERVADEKQARSTIASFVKENGITYPCLIGDDKTKAQVRDFQGFPTTLYIDRQGKVRGKVVGFNPEDAVDSRVMEELVSTLLAEAPAPDAKPAP